MKKEKLLDSPLIVPKSVGLTRAHAELAEKLAKQHKARSLSDYIRGLVLLDAFIVEGRAENVRPSDLPAWLLNEYTMDFIRKARAEYLGQKKAKPSTATKSLSLDDLEKWE